ncbi:hypothetical protein OYT40_002164 [Escherichia coli]|nr:hypothetical protein [Escherichia coli]
MAQNGSNTDEFTIELNLTDKVTQGYERVAKNLEARIAKFEARINKLNGLLPPVGGGLPAGGGGVPRPSGQPKQKNFDERAYAASNSALINRMMGGNAASAMAAMEAKSKVWAAAGRANLEQSSAGFRRTIIDTQNGLRSFNQRTNATGAALNNAGRNAAKFGAGASQGHSGLQGLITGFFALHTVVHLLTEAVREGIERKRAENAMSIAYNKTPTEATEQMAEVKKLSDTYGTNLSEAYQQSAKIKNLLGDIMSNRELAKYHEAITVEGGVLGNTEEEKNRFTLALEKMAGAKNGGGAQFIQLQKAMPAVLARMAREQGLNQTQLRAQAKGMTGDKFAKLIADFMSRDIETKGQDGRTAKETYSNSQQVMFNRVQNDAIDSLVHFSKASEEGVSTFAKSLSELLRNNQWIFEGLGHLFGDFMHGLAPVITWLSDFLIQLDVIKWSIKAWYDGLSPTTQHIIDMFTDFAKDFVAIMVVAQVTKTVTDLMGAVTGVTSALKALAGVEAAGAGGAGLLGLINPITAVIAAMAAIYMVAKDHMSEDGQFFLNPADVAKRNEGLHSGSITPSSINATNIVGGGLGAHDSGNESDKYNGLPMAQKSIRDIVNSTNNALESAQRDYSTNSVYMRQKLDIDIKPVQQTELKVVLDWSEVKKELLAEIGYQVQDSERGMNFGNSALSYNPTKSPAYQ